MPPPASTRRKDDFDMARLQKSLQQRRRHSLNNRPHVAKLTPAEIRSLNNSAAAAAKVDTHSSHRSSLNSTRRASGSTPPATPENYRQSAYQAQVSRSSSFNLPTPPHSPTQQHRRASHSSVQSASVGHPRHGSHIHAPIPRHSAQTGFMIHGHSRPSSSTGIHNLPMYRGHEVTRTGSKNMLQRPAHEIVTNPLSMYSRPRQSLVHSSPDRQRPDDFPDMDPYQAEAMLDADDDSNDQASHISSDSSRPPSTPPVLESPISFDDNPVETEKFSVVEPSEVPQQSRPTSTVPPVHALITALPGDPDKENAEEITRPSQSQPVKDVQNGLPIKVEEAKKAKKRSIFSQGLFDQKDKDKPVSSFLKKKKNRRQTVSFTKSADKADDMTNGDSAMEHDEADGLLGGSNSDTEGNRVFPSNPGVRPLSSGSDSPYLHSRNGSKRSFSSDDISSSNPGRAKSSQLAPLSIPARPVYSRCACCGKLKRPPGTGSELSPVFENENIRTNFSFEADRSRVTHGKQPSVDKRRFIPIIPMQVREGDAETGSIRTVQASIAPYDPSLRSSSRMSISDETSMSGAIGRRIRSDSASESRVTRFSSLHVKKLMDDEGNQVLTDEPEMIEDSTPVVERNWKIEKELETQESQSRPQSQFSSHLRPDSGIGPHQEQQEETVEAAPVKAAPAPYDHRKSMPKQDVINVVGWSNGRRVDESGTPVDYSQPQPVFEAAEPDDSLSTAVAPSSPVKETSKEEKKKSRVGGILKALQPRPKSTPRTLDEEEQDVKARKRRTQRMSVTSTTEEALDILLKKPQIAPSEKGNQSPNALKQFTMSGDNKSREKLEAASKFPQYDAQETKKLGHAPKLSLNLGGEDGGLMSLPTPNLGLHFARSSNSLKDLVMTNGFDTLETDDGKIQAGDFAVNGIQNGSLETSERDNTGKRSTQIEADKAMERAEENEMDKHRGKVAAESGILEKRPRTTMSSMSSEGIAT